MIQYIMFMVLKNELHFGFKESGLGVLTKKKILIFIQLLKLCSVLISVIQTQ